jgi:hypothetical protein
MGILKTITVGTEQYYLDDTWSWLTFDPTSKEKITPHADIGLPILIPF